MMGEYMHVFATVLIYVEVYHIGLLLYSQKIMIHKIILF